MYISSRIDNFANFDHAKNIFFFFLGGGALYMVRSSASG